MRGLIIENRNTEYESSEFEVFTRIRIPDIESINRNSYWDISTHTCIHEWYLPIALEEGKIYEFMFTCNSDDDIDNSYTHLVVKTEDNVCYTVEYYDKPYTISESHLSDQWIKCDVMKTLKIDTNNISVKKTSDKPCNNNSKYIN